MDACSELLNSVRLVDFRQGLSERRAPWGTHHPGKSWDVIFYAIKGESCWLRVDSLADPIRVHADSICVLPHGTGHSLLDSPDTAPHTISGLRPKGFYGTMKYGALQGPHTLVYMGRFKFENIERNPLWSALPPVIHLQPVETPDWLDTLFHWFREELSEQQIGHLSVCSRIGELLVIQAARLYIRQMKESQPSFLRALRDPYLLKALNLVHAGSEREWTLSSLAAEIGISRSNLAKRFSGNLGMGLLAYVTSLRMSKAARLLLESDLKIAAIVDSVGYQSEPSFNLAFKKIYGVSPGRFRREQHGASQRGRAARIEDQP